jgi:glycosyltransferase involved in cell wall biosynthesis
VSVILTVYTRTCYLAQALDSVLAQSFRDYEVIVVDDSGSEAARQIVALRQASGTVRYLPNPATIGVVRSIVGAARTARGELIAILNDDDYWAQDLLHDLVSPLLADRRRVLSFCDHWVVDSQGQVDATLSDSWSQCFGRAALPEGDVASPASFAVVKKGLPMAIAALFRRNALDWSLLVPEVTGAYDYWMACLMASTRRPMYYVPKRLAWYRVHPTMETCRRAPGKGDNAVYLLSALRARNWFPELEAALRAELAEALLTAGRDKLHFDRPHQARRDLWRSFCLRRRRAALVGAMATFLPRWLRHQLAHGRNTVRHWLGRDPKPDSGNPLRSESFKPS